MNISKKLNSSTAVETATWESAVYVKIICPQNKVLKYFMIAMHTQQEWIEKKKIYIYDE